MVIQLNKVNKSFGQKKIFTNFDLKIETGELIAITGESGKGKTTLLNIIGLIESIDSGEVQYSNYINPKGRLVTNLRRYSIGYLFQNYALIENQTVLQNLNIALAYNKVKAKKDLILNAICAVSLPEKILSEKVCNLSGGEQQRIAIARLFLKPSNVILADEPTGSLDDKNKKVVIDFLKKMNDSGKTVIIVTHDKQVAAACNRIVEL